MEYDFLLLRVVGVRRTFSLLETSFMEVLQCKKELRRNSITEE